MSALEGPPSPQEWEPFLKVGTRLSLDDCEYEIVTAERPIITFAADAGGTRFSLRRCHVIEHLHLGRMTLLSCGLDNQLANGMSLLNQQRRNDGVRAFSYVNLLVGKIGWTWDITSSEMTRQWIDDLAKLRGEKKPSVSSLYEWKGRAIKNGLTVWGCAPNTHLRGIVSLPDDVQRQQTFEETAYDEGIELFYLTLQRHSLKKSYKMIRHWLRDNPDQNKRALLDSFKSIDWFYRRIRGYDQHYVTLMRYGKAAAERAFRAAGRGREPTRVLQNVTADGLVIKCLMRSRRDGRIMGYVYATIFIDEHTGEIPACRIFSVPFCAATVLATLETCVTEAEGCSRGTPGLLSLDNCPSDYATKALKAAAAFLGIKLTYSERRKPNHKALLERINRELNEFVRTWPGATQPDLDCREYDPEATAVLFDDQAEELMAAYLAIRSVDASGTKRAPKSAFEEGIQSHPPLLYTQEQADMLCRIPKGVVVSSGRVRYQGLFWFAHSLKDYETKMRRLGRKPVARIFYKESDLSEVWVRFADDGKERMIKAKGTKPNYMSRLTLAEHLWVAKIYNAKRLKDLAQVPEEALARYRYELGLMVSRMARENLKELKKFGAILFGPPNKKSTVKKFHICVDCYKVILGEMKK